MAANTFAGVADSFKSGAQFAQSQVKLGLQEKEQALAEDRNRRANEQFKITRTRTFFADLHKASQLPTSVGKAFLKSVKPAYAEMGLNIDAESEASLFEKDEKFSKEIAEGLMNINRGFKLGSTEMISKGIDSIDGNLGKGQVNAILKDAATQSAALDRIEAQGKIALRQTKVKATAAAQVAANKAEAKLIKNKAVTIKDLRGEANALRKEFAPLRNATQKIEAIISKDPEFKNAQTGVSLVRLFSAMTEERASVVREQEFKSIGGAAGLMDRAVTAASRFTGKDVKVVPDKVLRDIVASMRALKIAGAKIRKRRFDPIVADIKAQNLQGDAERILGTDAETFLNPAKSAQKKLNITPEIQASINKAKQLNNGTITKEQLRAIIKASRK